MSIVKELPSETSAKGWNWGWYHFHNDRMSLTHDSEGKKKAFELNFKEIAISNASKANEVTLEFQQDANESKR